MLFGSGIVFGCSVAVEWVLDGLLCCLDVLGAGEGFIWVGDGCSVCWYEFVKLCVWDSYWV